MAHLSGIRVCKGIKGLEDSGDMEKRMESKMEWKVKWKVRFYRGPEGWFTIVHSWVLI